MNNKTILILLSMILNFVTKLLKFQKGLIIKETRSKRKINCIMSKNNCLFS